MAVGNVAPPFGAAAAGAGDAGRRLVDPAELETAAHAARRFGDDAEDAGRRGERGFGRLGREIEGVRSNVGMVRGGVVQLAAALYSIEAAAGVLKRALVDPVAALTRNMVEAREQTLRFESALGGVAGAARAREISSLLTRQARGQAAPLSNVRESALALASNPALASSVAGGTPGEVAGRVIEMNRTVQRLASIDPAQGEQGSLTALRELTEGDTASLRRRFGISPQQLAQAVGSSVSDIRSDPSLALAGLSKIAETLVPDSVIEEQGRLVSTRIAKIADAMREGLDQVGRSGVYDDIADRLGELQRDVFKYLDSSEFRQQAQRIGDGLGRALDNAGDAVRSFLSAISGNADAGGIAGAVGTAGGLLDKLALASDGLPRIAAQLGTGFADVARVVGEAAAVLGELASKLDVVTAVRMKLSPEDRERVRIANLGRALEDMGLPGVVAGRTEVGARPAQVWETPKDDPRARRRADGRYEYPIYASTPDVSGVESPRLQALAERAVQALPEDVLPLEMSSDRRQVAAMLKQRLPAFDSILAQSRGLPDPALAPRDTPLPPRLAEWVHGEDRGENYAAATLGATARLGGIAGDSAGRDDLADLATAAGSAAQALNVFPTLARTYAGERARLQGANDDAATLPETDYRRAGLLASIQEAFDASGTRYNAAVGLSADAAADAARAYGQRLAQALADVPLSADAFAPIRDGTSAFARRVADALDEAGRGIDPRRLGTAGMSVAQQQAVTRAGVQRRLDDEQLFARVGVIAPGDSPGDIERARPRRPDIFQSAGRQAAFLRDSALPQQAGVLGRANNALADAPDDPLALRDAAEAAADYARLNDLMRELAAESSRVRAAFVELGEAGGAAIQQGLGDVFYSLLTNINDVEDALRRIPAALARAFADQAAQQATAALFSLIGKFGKVPTPDPTPTITYSNFDFAQAAEGGVFDGGFTPLGETAGSRGWTGQPIRAFAEGGMVSAPTLGLVGEAGYPEAVIPLKHGAVPVDVRGGSARSVGPVDNSIEFVVVADQEEAMLRTLQSRKGRQIIGTISSGKIVQSGAIRRGDR